MKITCPKCALVIDAGDVPDSLLPLVGDGILSVRCPKCRSEIELIPIDASLSFAGSTSTWTGMIVTADPDPVAA
jgi:phage FluMu protein Com